LKKLTKITYAVIVFSLFFSQGCTRKDKSTEKFDTKPVSIKKYDTPPGADLSVSAEFGGNGFTGEGWEANNNYNTKGNPKAVKGGSIVMSLIEFPNTLRITGKDYNNEFHATCSSLLYESLLDIDPITSDYTPLLATHWKILDDKKTYKFRINPAARWADGKPVTSDDFLASWKLYTDPEILDPYTNELMNSFEAPVADSKYIISVKSKTESWKQFYLFATEFKLLPAHYIQSITGKEYLEKYQFGYIPGSGPYVILEKDIIKGQSIILHRCSDYWGEKERFNTGINNFDIIKFVFVNDESLEYERFKKGEIDVVTIRRVASWKDKFDFEEINRGLILKRRIFNERPSGIQGVCINTRKAPYDDIRIRKALFYAFDRKKFNEKLFSNSYNMMNSYYAGTEYENPSNIKFGFSLDSAKMLLSEAGWTEKSKEDYLIKNGQVFEIDMPFQKGQDRYFTIYQEDLKKIGIKLNLKEIDLATTIKLGDERNFTLLPITWTALSVPNPESGFKSNLAVEKNNTNWQGIKDKKIDELCDKYSTNFSKNERVKIIRQIDKILTDYAGYILMWYAPYQRVAFHNKFGYPDGLYGRDSGVESILYLWYCDSEKIPAYNDALKDASKTIDKGEVDNKFWMIQKEKK
jgi:microcin C transport system substrate-binding protein